MADVADSVMAVQDRNRWVTRQCKWRLGQI